MQKVSLKLDKKLYQWVHLPTQVVTTQLAKLVTVWLTQLPLAQARVELFLLLLMAQQLSGQSLKLQVSSKTCAKCLMARDAQLETLLET